MAYSTRRRSTRRAGYRKTATRRTTRRSGRSSARTGRRAAPQTLRIVIESPTASPVSRGPLAIQKEIKDGKAKY